MLHPWGAQAETGRANAGDVITGRSSKDDDDVDVERRWFREREGWLKKVDDVYYTFLCISILHFLFPESLPDFHETAGSCTIF